MTEIIITSSFLILIITALRFLLRRHLSPTVIYAMWAIAALRLLLPFSVGQSELSLMNLFDFQKSSQAAVTFWQPENPGESEYIEPDSISSEIATTAKANSVNNSALPVLNLIWLCGISVTLAFSIVSNIRMYSRLKASRKELHDPDSPLTVYAAEDLSSPLLFGFVKPSIYINGFAADDSTRYKYVITHELAHYRHGDHLWALIRILCLAVHWFNPLVWLAAYLSRQDSELACDSAVIKAVGNEHSLEYGRTLVDMLNVRHLASDMMLTSTTMSSDTKSIKERITMLKNRPKTLIWTAAAAVIVVAVALVITFTAPTASASDAIWDDASLQYLLEDVPVFKGGDVAEYSHYVKGNVYEGDSFIPDGYVAETDMLIIQLENVSPEYISEYTEILTGAGFTYFAEKTPDDPEIPNLFIAYNAPANGIGIQLEIQDRTNAQLTVFTQSDGCNGIYDPIPKG